MPGSHPLTGQGVPDEHHRAGDVGPIQPGYAPAALRHFAGHQLDLVTRRQFNSVAARRDQTRVTSSDRIPFLRLAVSTRPRRLARP